jgi:murein DD-endopeptidase MepM/ murein hydrolase activator NlpD
MISMMLFLVVLSGCTASANGEQLSWPLPGAEFRETPLYFGLYVTPDPAMNPIDPPERFEGYHVATDFEVSKNEVNQVIPVFSICAGDLTYSGFAEGYGGLITQQCTIHREQVTVIYGHLDLASLKANGTHVMQGTQIATLAAGHSHDSDNNRKHLHLGIRKGWISDIRGYVQTTEDIKDFIDPLTVLGKSNCLSP